MVDSLPLRINPEMLSEIAMGLGTPVEIAYKYGLTELEFMQLSGHKWFERAVEERRAQLEAEGFTPRAKFANMAEDLLTHCYRQALVSNSLSLALDVAKYLTKVGGLEPQPNQQLTAAGAGFQLVINVPGTAANTPQNLTIDAHATTLTDLTEDLGAPPAAQAFTSPLTILINNQDLTESAPTQ